MSDPIGARHAAMRRWCKTPAMVAAASMVPLADVRAVLRGEDNPHTLAVDIALGLAEKPAPAPSDAEVKATAPHPDYAGARDFIRKRLADEGIFCRDIDRATGCTFGTCSRVLKSALRNRRIEEHVCLVAGVDIAAAFPPPRVAKRAS